MRSPGRRWWLRVEARDVEAWARRTERLEGLRSLRGEWGKSCFVWLESQSLE
jgi:hypothetical protein